VQSHAASTLILSLDQALTLLDQRGEPVVHSHCFLLPAGIELSMHTHGARGLVGFLDALGVDLTILTTRMQRAIPVSNMTCHCDLVDSAELSAQAAQWLVQRPPAEQVFGWLERWIGVPAPGLVVPGDERIVRAIALIKQNYSHNDAIDDLARELCLSVPRLAQLFRQITGIAIRRYRLWHRLYVTVLGLSRGLPLNEAALQAGFSDYSHFSRAFKSIGGVNPSEVLSGREGMDIRVLAPDLGSDGAAP
jgi:AraC-like DNA-binding protein